jgi:hypothetical protein
MPVRLKTIIWAAGSAVVAVLTAGILAMLHYSDLISRLNFVHSRSPQIEAAPVPSTDAYFVPSLVFWRAVSPPPEAVTGEHFRDLLEIRAAPRALPDAAKLRALMDRGVIAYARSRADDDRQKAAELVQAAALLGFVPARKLMVNTYPESEPVRRVVLEGDVVRYAAGLFASTEIYSEDAKSAFIALARYFAGQKRIEFLASGLVENLRGDTRPQLSRRIDLLLELSSGVPGACRALARAVAAGTESGADECSAELTNNLRRYIEAGRAVPREADLRRRGFIILDRVISQ